MSHRLFDEMARLRAQLGAVEAEIAAVRAAPIVDFGALLDLRNTRDVVRARIAATEEAAHDAD